MKPAWDKLMVEFEDSTTSVVADVDCTAGGKSVCDSVGVRSYPSIKYGDPNNLEEYKGGRDFDSLKKFAESHLGPSCGPANLEVCSNAKKEIIDKFSKMTPSDLEAFIKEKSDFVIRSKNAYKTFTDSLQKQYLQAKAKMDKDMAAVVDSGLAFAKAVAAHSKHTDSGPTKTEL